MASKFSNYASGLSGKKTTQTKKVIGRESEMVMNNAGGAVFTIPIEQQLKRFLVLGSENGSFYQSEQELTENNAKSVIKLIKEGKSKFVIDTILEVAKNNLARKPEPSLFALSLVFTHGTTDDSRYAITKINQIVKTGTHLFTLAEYIKKMRGWGEIPKKIFKKLYLGKSVDKLAYQFVKYKNRNGWSHSDILRLCHIIPESEDRNILFRYALGKAKEKEYYGIESLKILEGNDKALSCKSIEEMIKIIKEYKLSEEMIPTEFKSNKEVQAEILVNAKPVWITRNLGRMTMSGLIDQQNHAVISTIKGKMNEVSIKDSGIHPLQLLDAIKVYASGRSTEGKSSWKPVGKISTILDSAFESSFQNVIPTNKNIMLCLDVSGSMGGYNISGSRVLTCREASAGIAMITAKTEANYSVYGFSEIFVPLEITPEMTLNETISKISDLPFNSTDCALPMVEATKNKWDVDAFVIYTDNETYVGKIHPFQALKEYRRVMNKPEAKLIVCTMTATKFSIADPQDRNMLDVVGFSPDTPRLISEFISGNL